MIALTAAMQPEIELIRAAAEEPRITKWNSWEFVQGRLCGKEIAAVRTGVGKVLSAAVTQKMIDLFNPEAVILSGIGGSINPEFRRGDIVIGTESIQHDMDATLFGFERGRIPYTDYHIIPSDSRLTDIALEYEASPVKKGRILTGDQFISGAGRPEFAYLRNELGGDIVDMEGAAAGLTALINNVPFLIIRIVSDNADGKSGGGYQKFLKSASKKNFDLICHIIRKL